MPRRYWMATCKSREHGSWTPSTPCCAWRADSPDARCSRWWSPTPIVISGKFHQVWRTAGRIACRDMGLLSHLAQEVEGAAVGGPPHLEVPAQLLDYSSESSHYCAFAGQFSLEEAEEDPSASAAKEEPPQSKPKPSKKRVPSTTPAARRLEPRRRRVWLTSTLLISMLTSRWSGVGGRRWTLRGCTDLFTGGASCP